MIDSGVEAIATDNQEIGAAPADAVIETDSHAADEAELGAVWDDNNVEESAQSRDETGRFVSDATETSTPVEGEGEVAETAPETSTPEATDVPLPSNWQGMEEQWKAIPAELRHDIAERENNVHKSMSEQGRQIGAMKPVNDVIEQNMDQFVNIKGQDGNPVQAQDAINYLFQINRDMNANPVETILKFAQTFGVSEQVAAGLGVNGQPPKEGGNESVLLEKIAGLERSIQGMQNPANIDRQITDKLQQANAERDADAMISRLTKDKPLYAEIPEAQMGQFITMTQRKLGPDASMEEVFNQAYDMAIHADPNLRAKVAAANAAATADPDKVAKAKKANGVNVTSTSSGKSRQLSQEEELGNAYDEAQRK